MFHRPRASFVIQAALNQHRLRLFSTAARADIRLINVNTMQMQEFFPGATPKYAILSHTWGTPEEEVSYADYISKVKQDTAGYKKIITCATMAKQFKLNWAWVDTCCIDKSSSAELSEAINSMYSWYQNSYVCFALLTDLRIDKSKPRLLLLKPHSKRRLFRRKRLLPRHRKLRNPINIRRRHTRFPRAQSSKALHLSLHWEPKPYPWPRAIPRRGRPSGPTTTTHDNIKPPSTLADEKSSHWSSLEEYEASLAGVSHPLTLLPRLRRCRWFKRGWTLQELLAPPLVIFFDAELRVIGTRGSLAATISGITGIQSIYLEKWQAWRTASVAQRFCWLSRRSTSREEDMSYCMLGLFDVNMPLLYGEGEKAFQRLQEQIVLHTSDESIFAWTSYNGTPRGLLAEHPKEFSQCADIVVSDEVEESKTQVTSRGIELTRGPKTLVEMAIWSLGVMPVPTVWHRLTYVLACEDLKKGRAVTIKLSLCRAYRNYPFDAPLHHYGHATWHRVQYKYPHYRRKSPDNLMARTAPLLTTKLLVAKHAKGIHDSYMWSDITWAEVAGRRPNLRQHNRGLDSNPYGFYIVFTSALLVVGSFYYAPTTKHRKDKTLILLLTPIIGPLLGITHPAVPLVYLILVVELFRRDYLPEKRSTLVRAIQNYEPRPVSAPTAGEIEPEDVRTSTADAVIPSNPD